MQEASKILSDLMPKVVLSKWDDSQRDKDQLKALVLQLSGVSHGIDSETGVPSLDPTVKLISRGLKQELTKAQLHIDQGQWKSAQAEVKNATQYCIACHSMTTGASSAYSLKLEPNLKAFSDYEKAVYYSAVRQFELAILFYEKALSNKKWAAESPSLWSEALQSMLLIVGRTKRDPDLIMDLISQFVDVGTFPKDLKAAARQWKADARKWRESKAARITIETTYSYLSAAKRSEGRLKNSGLIMYIRASSNLNELLRMGAVSNYNYQRGYYIAGQLADALADKRHRNFANDYYTLCIDKSKKTKTAKLCANALKKRKI